jgi:uncharacterized Ntn-hydrolase superfamily protein
LLRGFYTILGFQFTRNAMIVRCAALAGLLFAAHAHATYSIVAIDPETREVGSAGATCINNYELAPGITRIVPGKGAVNFQAYTNTPGLPLAVQHIQSGDDATTVMNKVNAADSNAERRQNLAITLHGSDIETAVFTGTVPQGYGGWAGSAVGDDYVIAGNILIGSYVVDAMRDAYLAAQGDLRDRLMQSVLAASKIVGADERCLSFGTSAATAYVRVAQPGDLMGHPSYYERQDAIQNSTDPVAAIYQRYLAQRPDGDGDGVSDIYDAFPADPGESKDSDGDGIGDNSDPFPNDPNNGLPASCGEPSIDPASDRGLFLWQECSGNAPSNRWHMRLAGGGIAALTGMESKVIGLSKHSNLQESGLEQNDEAQLSASASELSIAMRVYNSGVDGLSVESGDNACMYFVPGNGTAVFLGANKRLHNSPSLAMTVGLDCGIDTDNDELSDAQEAILGTDASNADSDSGGVTDANELAAGTNPLDASDDQAAPFYCGEPVIDPATDRGVFLWKDCNSSANRWSLRLVAGGGKKLDMRAQLEDTLGISDITAVSFESNDRLEDNDPKQVQAFMSAWNAGVDGVDFTVNGEACYVVGHVNGLTQLIGTQFGERRVLNAHARISLNDGGQCYASSVDTDADGLTDIEEMALGTNPAEADTDGDRLQDGEEVKRYKTDPLRANTDRDGLSDWAEVTHFGTDPLDADSDDDGLTDGQERKTYKTDPLKADTDGGGVSDGDEVQRGTNPLDRADD